MLFYLNVERVDFSETSTRSAKVFFSVLFCILFVYMLNFPGAATRLVQVSYSSLSFFI